MIDTAELPAPLQRKPLVSVCIVAYNQEDYIRDAVISVLAQSDPAFDVEVLIGDDASTDATGSIVRELASRHPGHVIAVCHRPNIGAAANYLELMRRARGDYIAHLDGDDYWLPGKLAAQLAFLGAHPECMAVYTAAVVVNANGVLVGSFSNAQPDSIDADYLLAGGNFLNHSSLFYRAAGLRELLKISPPFIDYLLHLKLAAQGRLGVLRAAYVVYRRMTGTSMLKNQFTHVDQMYLQTIISQAGGRAQAVRAGCCASYTVNTLLTRPSWCVQLAFWSRITGLRRELRVSLPALTGPLVAKLISAAAMVLSGRIARCFHGKESLQVIHPRL